MKYLIDTDWVINHLKGENKVVTKLEELAPEGVAISVISLAEIYEGVYYSKDPVKSQKLLEEFLAPDLKLLNVDEEICKIFGKERGKLRQKGKIVSDFDLLIASTCLRYNLTILTNNRRHYEIVEGLNMLSLL
ncbi:MAG: type II toxin-antitoxin system VapC family toxin [Thermodesulfobacteriota bacterium]